MSDNAPASEPNDEAGVSIRISGWDILIGLAIAFVGSAVFGLFWIDVVQHGERTTTTGLVIAGFVGIWIGFLGYPLFLSRQRGTGSLRRDFGLRFELPRDAWRGILWGVFAQVGLVNLIYLPLRFIDPDKFSQVSKVAEDLTSVGESWRIIPLAAVLVIGAPLAEEVFFRGLVQNALGRRLSAPFAIGATAIIFGLTHVQGLQLPALIALGVILSTMAHRNGRLGENFFCHAAFNAVTVIALATS